MPLNLKVYGCSFLCEIFLKFALLNCITSVTILCDIFKSVVVIYVEVLLEILALFSVLLLYNVNVTSLCV